MSAYEYNAEMQQITSDLSNRYKQVGDNLMATFYAHASEGFKSRNQSMTLKQANHGTDRS